MWYTRLRRLEKEVEMMLEKTSHIPASDVRRLLNRKDLSRYNQYRAAFKRVEESDGYKFLAEKFIGNTQEGRPVNIYIYQK